jgi:hypothetical protein
MGKKKYIQKNLVKNVYMGIGHVRDSETKRKIILKL